ncbi:MAG: type II secretion system protein [Rhodospirillaceae bacterium]|nr:type II secretion system protein [Rhodospirillaceae bacterium]
MKRERDEQRGFTLLEVIVVLMISSLIAAILFQGLSLILDTRFRVMSALTRVETIGLQTSIITSPLRGMLPDHAGEPGVFSGDSKRLKGLTLNPLQGTNGAPTAFAMDLNYDISDNATLLTYSETGYAPVEIARWTGSTGAFTYRGRVDGWVKRWPPPLEDKPLQVPRTIRLDTGLEQRPVYVVRVMGPHNRAIRAEDLPFGSSQ